MRTYLTKRDKLIIDETTTSECSRSVSDVIDVRDSVQCGHYATVKGLSSEVDMIHGVSIDVE